MRNRMKWMTLGFFFVLVVACFWFLFFNPDQSNVSHAKVTIEESKIYQKKEIESAIDIVFKEFKEFPATLEEIWYQDNKEAFDTWAKSYGKDDVIILYSNFTTYDNEETFKQGFGRNEKYEKWMWILSRNQGEDWELKDLGWG